MVQTIAKRQAVQRTYPNIYLAGKANGRKWGLVEGVRGARFYASDYKTHGPHLDAVWDDKDKSFSGNDGLKFELKTCVINEIEHCDLLIAFLDSADSYGSIAEIAYASAWAKRCHVLICEEDFTVAEDKFVRPMLDAYWLVCNFPYVQAELVSSKNATDRIRQIVNHEISWRLTRSVVDLLESPIEKQFFGAVTETYAPTGVDVVGGRPCVLLGDVTLWPQYEVRLAKNYRLDFLFEAPAMKLVVEVDGHDYHERTKEQARRDKERDRALTVAGYTVMRFTGSEIYHDAPKAAREVLDFLGVR